jgi:hypothetical protein
MLLLLPPLFCFDAADEGVAHDEAAAAQPTAAESTTRVTLCSIAPLVTTEIGSRRADSVFPRCCSFIAVLPDVHDTRLL